MADMVWVNGGWVNREDCPLTKDEAYGVFVLGRIVPAYFGEDQDVAFAECRKIYAEFPGSKYDDPDRPFIECLFEFLDNEYSWAM